MFCQKCGRQVQPDAKFCMSCGAAIATSPALPPSTPATEPAGWMKLLGRIFGAKPDPSPVPEPEPGPRAPEDREGFWNKLLAPGPAAPTQSPTAPPAPATESLPYRLNHKFLTRAEASFFRVLQRRGVGLARLPTKCLLQLHEYFVIV